MTPDAATKLAHQRLSLLEFAAKLKNVTETCRQREISQATFCEYHVALRHKD
jgi:hypothetical protein